MTDDGGARPGDGAGPQPKEKLARDAEDLHGWTAPDKVRMWEVA